MTKLTIYFLRKEGINTLLYKVSINMFHYPNVLAKKHWFHFFTFSLLSSVLKKIAICDIFIDEKRVMCGNSCTFASSNSGEYRPFALVVRSFWGRCWFDYWNEGATGKPAGYNLPFHNNETKDLGNGLKQKLWVIENWELRVESWELRLPPGFGRGVSYCKSEKVKKWNRSILWGTKSECLAACGRLGVDFSVALSMHYTSSLFRGVGCKAVASFNTAKLQPPCRILFRMYDGER